MGHYSCPMQYTGFRKLRIWEKGFELLSQIYTISHSFPKSEIYALSSQIQRSANSVIANIAESHGRYHLQDKIRVLYISRGEISETRSHLSTAMSQNYISRSTYEELDNKYESLTKMLNAYITSLRNQKN